MRGLSAVVAVIVLLLAAIAFFNPHVNVPVISPVVCSLKGGTWYDGDILNQPGCYAPAGSGDGSTPVSTPTTDAASLPPGATPGPRPGTYYVNCFSAQCTSLPGAGPFGTTCGQPSTGEQLCQLGTTQLGLPTGARDPQKRGHEPPE